MTWIKTANATTGYRQMYLLAMQIIDSGVASRDVRHAARRVVRALEGVIDKPIADASALANARRRFAELATALEGSVVQTLAPVSRKSPGRENRAMLTSS